MSLLLSIDPGKTTGLALIEYHPEMTSPPKVLWSDELDFDETCLKMNQFAANYPDLRVVIEKFLITPQTGKNSQAPWSLEVTGVVRYLLKAYGHEEFRVQTPQRAKSFADNTRLRALGFWHRGGKGHANDALRHAVVCLVDMGWRPAEILT